MRLTLPFIGQIRTGRDAVESDLVPFDPVADKELSKLAEKQVGGLNDVIGGLLQFSTNRLSDEKIISKKLLLANTEWVYRNNDVVAQEVARVELQLFAVSIRNGEIVYDEIQEHPLLDLLDRFNTTTTRSDAFYMTQSHKKLTGDSFWLLDRNGKNIENIFILPPDKIELKLGDPTDGTANLVEGYLYKDVIDGKQIEESYGRDDLIHFKKPNPKNPFRGLGAVEALADTIDTDTLTNLTQRNFFDKGAISNFVLTTDAKLGQDQIKRLRAELRSMYTGARNAFTTMIFGHGLKPSPIGFSNKDMEFLTLLEWYRDKIMIGFGNTKATLGIIDDVNRASYESAHASWLRGTVDPDMASIVGTINEFLVPLYGKNLILGYKNPVPEDSSGEVQQGINLKQAGIITINEAREMAGQDAVPGGDIFAPNGFISVPNEDPAEPPVQEPTQEGKAMLRNKRNKSKLPPALAHIDLDRILRQRKMFTELRMNKAFKEAAKPLIRKMVNGKHKAEPEPEPRIHAQFTNDEVEAYYSKQIHVVDVLEGRFEKAVIALLGKVQDAALHNLHTEVGSNKALKRFMAKKELFSEEEFRVTAQLDLTPILMQELILAGQAAYELIGSEDTYLPYRVADVVKQNVDKFATSMLETDKKVLAQIISDGIDAGSSVPEISSAIQDKFGEYSKMQAERITRTEVLRVSNMASRDAFIQSGVVEALQWLIAPGADEVCLPYANKIVGLNDTFYEGKNEFQDGYPPIHPRCRCVLIPIVTGTRSYEPAKASERELFQARIAELEAQIDKRTKAFKEMHQQKADDQAYIKALEKHLGVKDE